MINHLHAPDRNPVGDFVARAVHTLGSLGRRCGRRRPGRLIRAGSLFALLWLAMTVAVVTAPLSQGLRGQYFVSGDGSGSPAHTARDAEITTANVALRWWFMAPESFTARWTGYLVIERSGLYTFRITSNDPAQLRIERNLVVNNPGAPGATGAIRLTRGAHRMLLESFHRGGPYVFEWAWARDGGPLMPVPGTALSTDWRDPRMVSLMRWLPTLWLAITAAGALAVAALAGGYGLRRARQCSGADWVQLAASSVAIAGLAVFYTIAATEHAQRVNTSKARADQSAYLRDAQEVYANWHGQDPPGLVGMRNRMPLYAGFQALFWDPSQSNDDFFAQARIWNVRLSLLLLWVIGIAAIRHLPRLVAANLWLIAAFGWFIFKAGYVQSELLFYSLFFLTFLACGHLLRPSQGTRYLLAAAAGIVAALAHLTKAAALPLVVIFLVVYTGREFARLASSWSGDDDAARLAARSLAIRRLAAGAVMLIAFLATLSPYLVTNKQHFGRYFYNVNTTFYVWYDDWPAASSGTRLHGDGSGWPTLPDAEIPSMSKYLKTHSLPTILARVGGGAADMVVRSYQTYGYLKYVVLYTAFAVALIVANWRAVIALIDSRRALFVFLLIYGGTYLAAIAFYSPISGTGTTRFLLVHALPLLFTLSCFFTHAPFRDTTWRLGDATITPAHFHLLILVTIGVDLAFTLWPRLMSTYGGF